MKTTRLKLFYFLLLSAWISSPVLKADVSLTLKNTTAYTRNAETVEATIPPIGDLSGMALYDAANNPVAYQAVEGNKIVFQATVAANSTAVYTLKAGTPAITTPQTFAAQKMPSNRNDIAWENDLAAHRMYSRVLLASEPNTANGVDLWVKKKAEPVIDKMYTYANYHSEQAEGVDAYSVNGKTLGAGGIAAYVNGKLWLHDPYDECSIITNGPLQSEFVLTYQKVLIDGDYYTQTLRITASANGLLDKAVVKFDGKIKPMKIAAGIFLHNNMAGVTPNGVQYTAEQNVIGYAENKSEGTVTSANARFYEGVYMPGETSTATIDNHLVIMSDYAVGSEFTCYFGGGWNIFPAGRYTQDQDWFDALKEFKTAIQNPLYSNPGELPSKAEVINEGIRVNSLWQADHDASFLDNAWYSGVYHAGNMAFYTVYPQKDYLDYAKAWAESKSWGTGSHSSADADNVAVGQTYIDLYNRDAEKVPAKIAAIKNKIDNFSQQWWWIDAMYMAMPAYARLAAATGNSQYHEKMYALFKNTRDTLLVSTNSVLWPSELVSQYGAAPFAPLWDRTLADCGLFDKTDGLWYRDWGFQPGVPQKKDPNNGNSSDSDPGSDYCAKQTPNANKIFWGRGNGWAIGAMAHTLKHLPDDAPHREEYVAVLQQMAPALKARQREDGAWNMSLDDPNHRPGGETSATALITFALAYGINTGLLDSATYYSSVAKAWNNLVKYSLLTSGVVLRIQGEGEAPIDPARLMNSRSAAEAKKVAFGVGAFLCAASEVARLAPGEMPESPKIQMSLEAVELQDATHLKATFSHPLESASAQNVANYTIAGTPAVSQATLSGTNSVTLAFAEAIDYGRYTLIVSGVKTADGEEMGNENSKRFVCPVPLTPVDYAATITAIGHQTGNPPANVADNDLSTRWAQAGVGQWIQFEPGSPSLVTAVDIACYQGTSRISYFDVQVSTDGNSFTTVLDKQETSGLTDEMERYKFPEPTPARYVRIVGNSNSTGGENWNSITEVRIRFDMPPAFHLIMERIRETEWANVKEVAALDAAVTAQLDALTANGSWPDIAYSSTVQTNWEPISHLDRLKNLALAYTLNTSTYYGNEALFAAISQALEYWYTADPRSANWYMQQIGCPQRAGVILILMRAGNRQLDTTLENNLLARMESIGGRPDQSGSQGTGANKVDIATHWVYRGCLKENASVLSFGVEQVYYPVVVTTGEGLQSDYSYFQHGQQFFTGGYGYSFINGIARVANFTAGTQYAMPSEKLQLLTTFTRDAYLRLIRGPYFMYNVIGRGLSRPGALNASSSVEVAEAVKSLDAAHSEEYEAVIKRISGSESPAFGMTTGQKHYWRGDYSLYHAPAYNFDVRMASSRTYRNENGNGENIKGYFLSEGAHTLTVDGDEYLDIFPVWNWTRVPGITAPQKSSIPQPAQWGTSGTSTFAGGVSNGHCGLTVFSLNNTEYSINTSAKKAWFMFGKEIVCLGAGITSTASEEINTTLNQCLLDGDAIVSSGGTETTLVAGTHTPSAAEWIYHDKVGYFFPEGGNLNVSLRTATAPWTTINTAYADAGSVTKDVFTLWLNHGTKPTAASYACILVPGETLEGIRQYDSADIDILINSDSLQAVHHKTLNLWGFVFYKAASFAHADFTLKAGSACALLLENPGTASVNAWLSDPSQLKRKLNLRFVSTAIPEEKEYKATLPESPDAGATISFVIDASTPNYDPNVPGETKIYPTDDAYERDGSYGSTAFGMTDPHILVVKQDNADGYRRQASLKFDLSDLDASEIEEAELTLYVGRANANITATAWQLYYIANDNWSENTVTWNNKPPYSTLLGTFPGSPAGTKVTYNLTQAVITELASDKKLSMQIVSTERADGRTDADFISKDSPETDLLPHLLITNRRTGRSVVQPEPEIGMTIPGNPIRRGEEAVLHYRTPAAAVITVTVSDLSGRTVSESTISAVAGENRLPLKTSNLPAGLYLIRLTDRYNAQSGSVKLGIRN